MKIDTYEFYVDRKRGIIKFNNGYWIPIEDLNRFNDNISGGLFHLSKKNFISDYLFNDIVNFCKKEFCNSEFDSTLEYIKQRRIDMVEMFKSMKR